MSDNSNFVAFVSHAKADAKQANAIAAALESRGVKCWIAPRDVEPGRNFGDEIIRGIEASRAFVLVLSSASNGSDFVAKELATAVGKKKTVIPIRVEEVEPAPPLALFIAGTHWIDAFSGMSESDAARLAALLAGQPRPAAPLAPEFKPRPRLPASSGWIWKTGAALATAIALIVLIIGWPSDQRALQNSPTVDPVVIDPSTVPGDVPQVADTNSGESDILVGEMPSSNANEPAIAADPPPNPDGYYAYELPSTPDRGG
jgi:hypothetical protein